MIAFFRPDWRPGVRLQLTFWYTSVFVLLLFLAGAFLCLYLQFSLAKSLDSAIEAHAQQIANDITYKNGKISIHDATADLPGFDRGMQQSYVSNGDVNYEILVRLLDARGRPLHVTPAFLKLKVPPVSISQPLQGQPWQDTITTQDGSEQVRLYSRVLSINGKAFGIIQVGQSMEDLRETLHHIAKELMLLGVVVVLFSAIGSYWLASRALAPIQSLIKTARSIKGGDLSQRVPVPQAQDDLHLLAVTLNEMLESLHHTFARQRRFVADASHELRTPVAVIRSTTDVALLHASTQQEYVSVLSNVNSEAERLSKLINDLLALARGDEGQTKFEREPVKLDQLVDIVAANAEPLAAERNITIERGVLEPVTILADEARLIQMVMNLIDNAILYTNQGGTVCVSVACQHGQAAISVRDNGVGIAPEHLPHIFERFYRVDPARTRTEGGSSGLGLAIVEWIVRAHKGSIVVDSQPGEGTSFTVKLPPGAEEYTKKADLPAQNREKITRRLSIKIA
ncbi:MAG: ATP-binding protein [Ktedonobacteraceae bacterium]